MANFFDDDGDKKPAAAPAAQAAAPNAAPIANGNFFRDPPPDAAAAPAAPPTPMPAAMTYDKDDPNAGWGSWALSKLHNAAVGGNLFNRVVTDSATFGGADKLQSLVPGGSSVDELRTQTDQSRKDIGPVASALADASGYALGGGSLGAGEKIAAKLGGSFLARMGGSAAENAGASAIGTLGHGGSGEDAVKSAVIGGSIGALTGAIPGQRGALARGESPKPILDAVKSSAYKPLESTHYDPGAIADDFDALKSGLSAKQSSGIGDALDSQIDKISRSIADKQKAGQSVTADDIANFQNQLKGAAKSDVDIRVAEQFKDGLSDTLKTTKPLYTPLSGPAEIAAQAERANAAALKSNTNNDIEGWMKQAQDGDTAGTQSAIRKKLDDSPNFYKTVGDQLAAASQKPGLVSQIAMKAAHPVGDALVSGGAEYMFGGHDIGSSLAAAAAGAAGGAVLSHSLSQARTNDLVARLAQARHINIGGAPAPLSAFKPGVPILGPLGVYTRRAAPALGASGAFMDYGKPP